jgi:hypothetical protein
MTAKQTLTTEGVEGHPSSTNSCKTQVRLAIKYFFNYRRLLKPLMLDWTSLFHLSLGHVTEEKTALKQWNV